MKNNIVFKLTGVNQSKPEKKVISFSLFGDNDLYCLGILENIDIINEKLVDWYVYVYYSNIPQSILNSIKGKKNTVIIECTLKRHNFEGLFWRFYPFEDNNVDLFLSRDADSRITDREIVLINKFIKSNKICHIIRDNPAHNIFMLGGTFGIKSKLFQKHIKKKFSIDSFIEKYAKEHKGPDQTFLCNEVYPLIKNNSIVHISYESLRMSYSDTLIEKSEDYVGKVIEPKLLRI
jgi:hypothetical protein